MVNHNVRNECANTEAILQVIRLDHFRTHLRGGEGEFRMKKTKAASGKGGVE